MRGVLLTGVQRRPRTRALVRGVLLLALLVMQGCAAVGERVGRRTAEGAVSQLERTLEEVPPEQQGVIAERNARAAVRAALEELASPEGQAHLRRVVDQAISQALQSAVSPSPRRSTGEENTGGSGPGAHAPLEDLGRQLANGLSSAVMLQLNQELGTDGSGPLAQALSASGERISASAARGVRSELEAFIGPCSDPDPRKCLDQRLHQLGKAASAGALEGIQVPLLVLTFAFGFTVCLLVMQLLGGRRRGNGRRMQVEEGRRKGVPA